MSLGSGSHHLGSMHNMQTGCKNEVVPFEFPNTYITTDSQNYFQRDSFQVKNNRFQPEFKLRHAYNIKAVVGSSRASKETKGTFSAADRNMPGNALIGLKKHVPPSNHTQQIS